MTLEPHVKIAFGTPQRQFKIANAAVAGFILTDKSMVISLRDLQKAFGFDGKSGNRIAELLLHISRFTTVPTSLLDAAEQPVTVFYEPEKWNIKTLDIEFLTDLLQTIITAKNNGFLNINQLKAAKTATAWQDYLQQNSLKDLIAESSGNRFQIKALKKNIKTQLLNRHADPVLNWTLALPDSFFEWLGDLYGYEWTAVTNTNKTAKIINDLVFSRLDAVTIVKLSKQQPKRTYKRKTPQDEQQPELQLYLSSLRELSTAAANHPIIFERLLQATHPKNPDWPVKDADFVDATPETASLSNFNAALLKSFKRA